MLAYSIRSRWLYMKKGLLLGLCIALLALSAGAMAAHPVSSGDESSTLIVTTSARSIGSFTSSQQLAWQQTNGDLTNNSLQPGQTIATIGYNEHTMAVGGNTTYEKRLAVDTGSQIADGNNLRVEKIIEFDASDDNELGGRMVSEEDVLVDTISASSPPTNDGTDGTMGCSLTGETDQGGQPASHETVMAGSSMDVTEVSAHTSATARTVSDSPDTPVSLTYGFDARGINQTPGDMDNAAVGSATVFVDARIQTGSSSNQSPENPALGTDMQYDDVTRADGLFELARTVNYNSGPDN